MRAAIGVVAFDVPGSAHQLIYERDSERRLLRLRCDERVYAVEETSGERTYGDGLAFIREMMLPNGLLRHVRAAGTTWIEEYLWDEVGRPLRVDGVEIVRDGKRRVTECRADSHRWLYGYAGDDLVVIDSPRGTRQVTRGVNGRPVMLRERDRAIAIRYADDGRRDDIPALPATWNRDELGRLWTIHDDRGNVETTFLWDGFACIGRIDGDVGAPLAAWFSLDPSCTPVRIVTAAGVTRVPRDAFGEGLLDFDRVPGLYGGALYGGFVHLRSRALDPRTGAFDCRDPWDGLQDDPRRAGGFSGPLLIENAACGPYAVCQYDPVGRTDPTGEVSVGLIFLDLTWALQHNFVGWFGFDWTIGFLTSLFAFPVKVNGETLIERWFDYEGLYNDRTGVWGLRRGFWGIARPFAYQHFVISRHEKFEDLQQINVIDPGGLFEPTLYGTMLRVDVSGSTPLLLRGNLDATLGGWTRSGGSAVAVAPGSQTPRFPSGGIHLRTMLAGIREPRTCTVTELVPSGAPSTATVVQSSLTVTVPAGTIAVGSQAFLSDTTELAEIKTVSEVAGTTVRFQEIGPTALTTGVRMRGLSSPGATDTLSVVVTAPGRISTVGATVPYLVGNSLQLSQAPTVFGVVISALEAQITIDGPLPASLTAPLELRTGVAGAPTAGTLAGNVLTSATLPSLNDLIVVTSGAQMRGAVVVEEVSPTERRLDRPAADLAPLGASVTWQPVSAATVIGSAAASGTTASLTYNPQAIQTAPASGLIVISSASAAQTTVRAVTGRTYDAIVVGTSSLPGNQGAPYQVVQYAFAPPDISDLTLTRDTNMILPTGVTLTGSALQFIVLPGPALTAGTAPIAATVTGTTATLAAAPALVPSQFVVLQQGATLETNVISRITATLTLDRSITFSATPAIDAIRVAPAGPIYDATQIDALNVVVLPTVGAGAFTAQMSRFQAGNLVRVVFGTTTQDYVVGAVNGTTLTFIEPPGTGMPAGTTGTVQLLVPIPPAPANGTWRVGMNGVAPSATTLTVDIWNAAHVSANTTLALVQGTTTHIAVVTVAPAFSLTFLTGSALTGSANVTTFPGTPTFYAPVFTQSGTTLTLSNVVGTLPPAGPGLFVVIPFNTTAITVANAQMSSGTTHVPVDAEAYEINRRKTLEYHELTHTRQAQCWGPLFMAYFPLFVLEGLSEFFTDVELPQFSPYVAATVEVQDSLTFVRIENMQGVAFETGSHVQIVAAGVTRSVVLGIRDGKRFQFQADVELAPGAVQVRRQVNDTKLTKLRDVTFNILNGATLGGVANYVAGFTWANVIHLIKKLAYVISHRLFHSGRGYPATVVDTRTIRMKDDEGRRAVQGFQRVYLQAGDSTNLFDVTDIANDQLKLRQTTALTGDITVKPYDTSDSIDGLEYYEARVADPAKPAQITIAPKGGSKLSLDQFDVVATAAGVRSQRTNVTAVNADGTVELEDEPPTFGEDRSLRVAYVDEKDPIGSADSHFLTNLGFGWMRWLFDPYRQFQYGFDPRRNSFLDILARIGRYAFSSHSWSAVIPGHLFLDDLFKQIGSNGHLSNMEQDASEESGNTYSPLAKIRGLPESAFGDFNTLTLNVGDIARYWYTPDWSNPSDQFVVTVGSPQFDAPAINVANTLIVVPAVGPEVSGSTALNAGVSSTDPRPGSFVPDAFYPKNAAGDPGLATAGAGPTGMMPLGRGLIPMTPTLELCLGSYVAFSRPGTHRVTVLDTIGNNGKARQAHDEKVQTIFYDVTVNDLAVQVAGAALNETVPRTAITMILTQRAVISVAPATGSFALTITRPGVVLTAATDGSSLVATATGNETVELSRVYAAPGTPPAYTDPVLAAHGVHLPVDIHVPLRSFTVTVVNTFTLVDAPALGATPVTAPTPGTIAFALIPANIIIPPNRSSLTYPPGTQAPLDDPDVIITAIDTPPALTTFIDVGRVFQFEFPATDPPEDAAVMIFSVVVGTANTVTLPATVTYTPLFVLSAPSFQVVRGASLVLSAGTTQLASALVVLGDPTGLTITTAGTTVTIDVAATAAAGKRRIAAFSSAGADQMAFRTFEVL